MTVGSASANAATRAKSSGSAEGSIAQSLVLCGTKSAICACGGCPCVLL